MKATLQNISADLVTTEQWNLARLPSEF